MRSKLTDTRIAHVDVESMPTARGCETRQNVKADGANDKLVA